MRVLHQDTRTNEIKLLPETIDDLWHMSNLLDESDLVYAMTYRRKEDKGDKLRPERTEKIRMRLGIRLKKAEFHESDDRLRLLGEIESGPQDLGQHHTLMIGVGDAITIVKSEWKQTYLERIKRAVQASERPTVVFVAIEDTEAVIAVAREYGFKEVANITRNPEGKMYNTKSSDQTYLEDIINKVVPMATGEPLVILGPGFTKETLAHKIRERHPDLPSEVVIVSTGQAGMAGIHEAMKKGLGGKAVDNSRVARETRLVEELFSEIGSDGLFSYGMHSVRTAAESGAIRLLLVLDSCVRTEEVDILLKLVEGSRGEFMIISSLHEAGRKLESLGGVAALLRYRVE
ncbi:MAG: mRNA surveillance protein pelota [Methanobacteriota archaeon]|nr:MAG: mRNA surveillance protein pelota [Euryarchaeota archaeon]